MMEKENIVRDKSYAFALRILKLYSHLHQRKEFDLSRQILRAGTSIGANVEEALAGQSRADFRSKMAIASKEARECLYWLRLLRDGKIVAEKRIAPLLSEAEELKKILSSIVKTSAER